MLEEKIWKECNVREAQKVMFATLEEIDKICKKHSITYWLDAGTLLGCMRHSGFIPWDDDLDIGMLRADYDKFIKIVDEELPPYLKFQTKSTDTHYHKRIPKIRNVHSKIIEDDECENEPYSQGIFVDIFVFDFISSAELSIRKTLENLLKIKARKRNLPKGSSKRFFFNLCHMPVQIIYTVLKSVLKAVHTGRVSNFIGTTPDYTTYAFWHKVEWVFPLKEATFEGRKFPIPTNADEVLTSLFGDWRKIPPENERRSHAKKILLLTKGDNKL